MHELHRLEETALKSYASHDFARGTPLITRTFEL